MFKLFRRKPKRAPEEPTVPAEAATILAMGTQGGIAAVGAVPPLETETEDEQPSQSEGAV